MRKEREQLINLVKLQAKEMEVRVCAGELVLLALLLGMASPRDVAGAEG
jgi:hypothetical protein